jgi:hypothetical protein
MKFFHSFKQRRILLAAFVGIASLGSLLMAAPRYVQAPISKGFKMAASKTKLASSKPKKPAATTPVLSAQTSTPPVPAPVPVPAPIALNFNHTNILTTYFWVGEDASADNGGIANAQSAWDDKWAQHYGGVDNPGSRNGYTPAGFTPKENPFYIALPYNDLDENGNRKPTASNCPQASNPVQKNYSWCKNSWVAIRHGNKIAYAQWEDVGPFLEDDFNYVFGSAAPSNKRDAKAGLDVSPAIRDYLGLQDVDRTDWTFVPASAVPDGPLKQFVTTSLGYSV